MQGIEFTYLSIEQVFQVSPHKSKSDLYRAIHAGKFPAPDHIGKFARWRSDLVGQAIKQAAARADAQRAELAGKAKEKARRARAAVGKNLQAA